MHVLSNDRRTLLKSRTAWSFLALLAQGCAERRLASEEVLGVLARQEDAWNHGDIDAFMDGYRLSAETSFSSDQGTIRGWQTVLDRYRMRYPDRAAMGKLTFSELEVRTLGDRAAVVTGKWRLERERDAPAGVFSLVLERFHEGWRIVHDHTSACPVPQP